MAATTQRKARASANGQPTGNGKAKSGQSSSSQRRGAKADDDHQRFGRLREYNVAKMASTEPPRPDFVVDRLAVRGEPTMVWGPAGAGKSLLLQEACAAVGSGGEVAGLKCKAGFAVYVDAENGKWEMHRRVHGVKLNPERIAIYNGMGAHLVNHADDFCAMVKFHKPDLLVLDSLRSLTPGTEENDSGAMAEVITTVKGWAQKYKVAIVVIHHARKGKDAFRGSSTIEDQLSIVHEMTPDAARPDTVRRVRCEKTRVSVKHPDMWVEIQYRGVRASVMATAQPSPAGKGDLKRTMAEEVLAATHAQWRSRAELATALGVDPKDSTLSRTLRELRKDGQLRQNKAKQYRSAKVVTPPLGGADDLTTDDSAKRGRQVVTADNVPTRVTTRRTQP